MERSTRVLVIDALLTANEAHFARVSGLRVIAYT
jgi:hypothetical protein